MSVIDLPPNATLQYLAEGAANIVYKIDIPPPSPSFNTSSEININERSSEIGTPPPSEITPLYYDPKLDRGLLRLRKALPSTVPVEQSHARFHDVFRELFEESDLVNHDLVRLPKGLIQKCNSRLRLYEERGLRPQKRRGLYLQEYEQYGMLVSDMTPRKDRGEVLVEFKPKWLAQSPSAPSTALRCRTCALRAKRNAARRAKNEPEERSFCSLDLTSRDQETIARAVSYVIPKDLGNVHTADKLRQRLLAFFKKSTLLQRLKELQEDLDKRGVLQEDPTSEKFLIAMTIRDCTLFLKVSADDEIPIEARIGDLDLKSPDQGKADYWRSLERALIEQGWYDASENDPRSDKSPCPGLLLTKP
ncbi:hypothetical protein L228DRAFT_283869 [Xylona heveae TC161]|uniref:Inositol-pentakisphosphate 2-kinase n=1 Tax=Xylona heveae (strain CBS 132557 / TC161) TaxID=1328760 RepID=A0A165G4S9_XYLHT|nr:hypothetical protein L228DRAFT_283869 [Xylona heveae TC161]KZF21739.1 hypothetical protein L228DRAFT_283869 [Xylona heveae TC161]